MSLTLAEAIAEVKANATFDLYLREGESPSDSVVTSIINRARLIINRRRHIYDAKNPLQLVAGQDTYGFDSGLFGRRVVKPYGGWLNWRRVRDCDGDFGVWDRADFEDSFPQWPFRPPSSSQLMARMDRSLVVWPAPTQTFIDQAKAASSGRKVVYRIDLKAASAGTYKLTLNTQETSALGPSASASSITSALVALSNVASGDVYINIVDGIRHIYDFSYVTGSLLNSNIDLTITTNTLSGGTATAECNLMGAFVQSQVVENNLVAGVDDSATMPEPENLHFAITDLATILSATKMANEDEAWRRLEAMNGSATNAIEEEARDSQMSFLSLRNQNPRRMRK